MANPPRNSNQNAQARMRAPQVAAVVLVCFVMIFIGWGLYPYYQYYSNPLVEQEAMEETVATINRLDSTIYMSACMAGSTNDRKWPNRYRDAVAERNFTMLHIRKWAQQTQTKTEFKGFIANDEAFMKLMQRAMDRLSEGDRDAALKILTSIELDNRRQATATRLEKLRQQAADAIMARHNVEMRVFKTVLTVFLIVCLALLGAWLRAARSSANWKATFAQERKRERKVVGKAVEDGLRTASLRSMSTAVSGAIDGLAMVDLEFNYDYVNPALSKLHACASPEEMAGRKVEEFLTEETFAELKARAQTALAGGEVETFEGLARAGDSLVHVEIAPSLVANDNGAPWAFLIIERDVTARKQVENELRKSRDFYLTLFEEFPNPVWRSDTEGYFDYFNNTWLAFVGRSLEEEAGAGWTRGVHPADIDELMETYQKAFKARESFLKEFRLRRYDGHFRWMVGYGRPFYDPQGDFCGYIGACYDVSDHREMEEELAATNRELESFVYTVSHDLRAPLVSLAGFARLLQEEYGESLQAEACEYLGRIHANVQSMNTLLIDLLELSRVGRSEEPKEMVDTVELVNRILDEQAATIKAAGAEISVAPDLPQVFYSETRLSQIFGNLISNAIKYARSDAKSLIEVGWQDSGDACRFFVKDNGIGIAPEDAERVFEIFSRLKQKSVEGTGIGLAIAKRVVEDNGGEIGVEGKPGEGSTFWFTIPGRTRTEFADQEDEEEKEKCELTAAIPS